MNLKMFKAGVVLALLCSSIVVAHDAAPVAAVAAQAIVQNKAVLEADAFSKEWKALKSKKNFVGFARLNQEDAPQLIKTVRELAVKSNIAEPPVFVFAGNPVHNVQSYLTSLDIRINAFAFSITSDCALVVVGDRLLEELPALQIRSIIAHEFGHITRNHTWRRLLWKYGVTEPITAGVIKMLAPYLVKLVNSGDISLLVANVLLNTTGRVVHETVGGFGSRLDEREADLVAVRTTHDGKSLGDGLHGLERVYTHDHPVWGYITFKIVMKYAWWMMTHPRTEVRAAYANAEEARLKAQLI